MTSPIIPFARRTRSSRHPRPTGVPAAVRDTPAIIYAPAPRAESFADDWRASYGRSWWIDLAFLGALVFLLGALKPLDDPDLPMHLATGEWIVRHHAVPFVEPFAWTRAGAPYYAYSWLLELIFYGVLRAVGPAGLHVLNGLMVLAIGAATIALGHVQRWKPWVSLVLAGAGIGVATMIVSALRPQLVLLSLVPLAWAFTHRILYDRRWGWSAAALLAASAIAANSHLFFVLMAAPLALCWMRPPQERRRSLVAGAAVLAGWLISPYALAWPSVFALNFGHNALLGPRSPVNEFRPGFSGGYFGLVFAAALCLIPWGVPRTSLAPRERYGHAALWLAGLVAFAFALRLLLVWWVLVLPIAALALEEIGAREPQRPPRPAVKIATYGVGLLLLAVLFGTATRAWSAEGSIESRRLPMADAPAIEPLTVWLQCHTRPGTTGRVFTWFNYGSYIAWRLPGFSESIDGRTIFPDSVAEVEALTTGWMAPRTYAAWSSADVAIIPRRFGVATALDHAPDWTLAAWSFDPDVDKGTVGLWVRKAWWEHAGIGPLPEHAHLQPYRPDAATCPVSR